MKTTRQHEGMVFITAMVALSVMFIVGVTFMQIASHQAREAERDLSRLRALASADAGLNYMIWNQKYPAQSANKLPDANILPANTSPAVLTPANYSTSLLTSATAQWTQEEQFNVWLMAFTLPSSPSGKIDGYQVVSKGRFRGHQQTLRSILRVPARITLAELPPNPLPPPVLDYALFSGTGLNITGSSSILGDVGCNLDLTVSSGASRVRGRGVAGGRVLVKNSNSISGQILEHQPQVVLADIIQLVNLYYYAALGGGNIIVDGNRTFWGNELVDGKVIYVKGDVTINANTTFSGVVTIVAEGNITINGNVSNMGSNTTSNLILMSPNAVNIKVNGNASIYATIIAPGMTAAVDGVGSASIKGAVVANSVSTGGGFYIEYLRPNPDAIIIPPTTAESVDESLAWTMASWQQLPGM